MTTPLKGNSDDATPEQWAAYIQWRFDDIKASYGPRSMWRAIWPPVVGVCLGFLITLVILLS